MNMLGKIILTFFPFFALILLIIGLKRNAVSYIISSLWLSLIALIIHFQFSGNQIFGTYFNYFHAGIYSFNLAVLLMAVISIIFHLSHYGPTFKYTYALIIAFLIVGVFIFISNLWINAYFVADKMEGTPIMQVALFDKPDYCENKYVFYKINTKGLVGYLCPNHYGLFPSIGQLATSPDFVATQLPLPIKKQLLLKYKNKS